VPRLATWIATAVASWKDDKKLAVIRREVAEFASDLPLPGVDR